MLEDQAPSSGMIFQPHLQYLQPTCNVQTFSKIRWQIICHVALNLPHQRPNSQTLIHSLQILQIFNEFQEQGETPRHLPQNPLAFCLKHQGIFKKRLHVLKKRLDAFDGV